MLEKIDIKKIIFLDIETVPLVYDFDKLSKIEAELFNKKTKYIQKYQDISAVEAYQKSGIYAEFAKIVCISVGYFFQEKTKQTLRIKSFYGKDEKKLLKEFNSLLNKTLKENFILCAHNGKEFDYPFMARRILINGLKLPNILNTAGKKPWEIKHLDTMELWKFGDYKHYTSLELLTYVFDIPTPKDDIDGSQVAKVFYEDKDLDRIIIYCEKDVIATIQLFLRYQGLPLIDNDFVIST